MKEELVKSLSFSLSHESRHKFDGALRQSYKDVAESLELSRTGKKWEMPAITSKNSETVDFNLSMTESRVHSTYPTNPEEQTIQSEQFVNSISQSQLPGDIMIPKPKTSARSNRHLHQDEEPIPNSAAGQARQFYYGTDENELTVNSKDFDHVYEMTGQS